MQTIRNRIDQFGVTEPVIQPTSTGQRIVVQLPGIDDPERVRRLIKSTAFLEFRIVRYPKGGGGVPSREEILNSSRRQAPGRRRDPRRRRARPQTQEVIGKTLLRGREAAHGHRPRPQQRAAEPAASSASRSSSSRLTPAGAEAFSDLTGKNVHSGLAIVLDGRVVSAPVINSRISDRGQIEGGFTEQSAQDLATVLRSGALPRQHHLPRGAHRRPVARPRLDPRRPATPASSAPCWWCSPCSLYYHLSGLNAILALVLNILILFGGMGAFHSTLTLPGIAGVILTIGMAVDANVLVFERIREEMRAGRTVRSAIDQGFDRAFTSIIDTHVTTLISALFLFQFGTGPIKGFAVTLTIGLLASIFTAVFVSRWMFDLVLSRRRVQRISI